MEQVAQHGVSRQNAVLTSRDGEKPIFELISSPEVDIVINVLSGFAGIEPSIQALRAGKTLLLGNKESVVAEGEKIMKLAENAQLIPLDSEHNAIYEILRSRPSIQPDSITLPCSGGPFLNTPKNVLETVTPLEALSHPKWSMGPKVSIESATLLNKGLEVIEAHYLFNLPLEKIKTVAHPECRIHGIVTFTDGQKLAYLSPPNMKEHIKNALLRAQNLAPDLQKIIVPLSEAEKKGCTLLPIDHQKLPGIKTVLNSFRSGVDLKRFLKREEAVIDRFLQNQIAFMEIYSELK